MTDEEQQQKSSGGGVGGNTALKAAAAAAATGAATYAVRRAMTHDDRSTKNGSESKSNGSGSQSILASAAATSWDAASDVLIPFAEDAAEAAGKYLATHGPDILRDRLVPKFIDAFNDTK